MKRLNISALNLVPVKEGETTSDAIQNMIELAKFLDYSSYKRYWIAEHHNTTSLASSATRQLIHHALNHTKNIRIGSGGVMLPNHSPLIVAEDFGTMHAIFKDRIDLGLGRAPGTDMRTASAIRRNVHDGVFKFEDEIKSIQKYFKSDNEGVVAHPGVGSNIPIYVLGSSTDSAYLAAHLGLPYAFAAHFAPQEMANAFNTYVREFTPSKQLSRPYKIACLNTYVAESDEEAKYLSTTMSQFVLNIVRQGKMKLQPPTRSDDFWSPYEKEIVQSRFPIMFSGNKDTVLEQLRNFQNQYNVEEIMAVTYIYNQDKQFKSFELFESVVDEYNKSNNK